MTVQDYINRKSEINKEIGSLPYISTVDSDGETNDDAYQEQLEQNWHIDELMIEFERIDKILQNYSRDYLGTKLYEKLGGDPAKY